MFTRSATTAADRGRRAFLPAVPALLALPVDLVAREPDPVFAAIREACEARDAFTAALEALDGRDRDKALIRAAGEAAERDTEARNALGRTKPTTPAGLHAVIRHHAEDLSALEPRTVGALAFRDLALMLPPAPRAPRPTPGPSLAARFSRIAAEAIVVAFLSGGGAVLSGLPHLI